MDVNKAKLFSTKEGFLNLPTTSSERLLSATPKEYFLVFLDERIDRSLRPYLQPYVRHRENGVMRFAAVGCVYSEWFRGTLYALVPTTDLYKFVEGGTVVGPSYRTRCGAAPNMKPDTVVLRKTK